MKKNLFVSGVIMAPIIILMYCASIYAQDLEGVWKTEFDTQIGVQKYTFTFVKTDSELTGKANADIGGELFETGLTDIKIDSNAVSFSEPLDFQGMELEIRYDGTIAEDELKLNRHVGDFGAETLVAKRQANAPQE